MEPTELRVLPGVTRAKYHHYNSKQDENVFDMFESNGKKRNYKLRYFCLKLFSYLLVIISPVIITFSLLIGFWLFVLLLLFFSITIFVSDTISYNIKRKYLSK